MRSQIRHKKSEARREIVGRVEFMGHLAEFDVFAVACDNAWPRRIRFRIYMVRKGIVGITVVSQRIQRRTTAPAIALLRRDVLRPVPSRSRLSLWGNMPHLPFRRNNIDDLQSKVPRKYGDVLDCPQDWCDEEHWWWNWGVGSEIGNCSGLGGIFYT